MMSDAMLATEAMVKAAASRGGHKAASMQDMQIGPLPVGHVFIDNKDGQRAALITVFESGRWALETFRGGHPLLECHALEALRFYR